MKYQIYTVISLAGGAIATVFGGWDQALQTLVLFMVIDWLTGGVLLPVVFGKIPKSAAGSELCERYGVYRIYCQ